MVNSQLRSRRKPSGGLYKSKGRKKKQYELAGIPGLPTVKARKTRILRTRGSNRKVRLLSSDSANIFNPKTNKYAMAKIKTVVDNPANRHFIRRNIMTKGSIIDTELGKARITSRPGQDGAINAVLV